MNYLDGTLPNNMFSTLKNLQIFAIGGNQISGSIPNSITNASSLQFFDMAYNNIVGKVPSLGNLKDLWWLNLAFNSLGNNSNNDLNFITSLKNCSKLEILNLCFNKFGGILPNSIGNLSIGLLQLYLGVNQIHGTIPEALGKYTNLIVLGLGYNKFSGTIPTSFGNFYKMQELALLRNQLTGEIPVSIGNLSQLAGLSLSENMFEGNIPPIFGNMNNLILLDLSINSFYGAIPLQIFGLSSLSFYLNLSHNSLNGSLTIEVGTLKNLGTLDISENHLSGEIPSTIGECTRMEYLNLQGNSFNRPMPSSLASLKGLTHLDISRNNLFGPIQSSLQNLVFLQYLNVSFNMLEGKVPTEGVFSNSSAISVTGNIKLCGGITELHLPPCPIKDDMQRTHNKLIITLIVICVAVSLLVTFMLAFYWGRKRRKISSVTSIEKLSKVTYQKLHFATEGFSACNLIGSGSFGSVYKGRIELEGKVVAIKVFNLQKKGAHKSFISECNALKIIRHRNLVKILTCCSGFDYKEQEFKALVFEYMSNGSLDEWLHPNLLESAYQCSSSLNLGQRLNAIYDVAEALHYLHYECEQPIVHCDLKPCNILLDDDMVAHVSDFGLARILSNLSGTSLKQNSTTEIKGTIGYTSPEYGLSLEVSTHGDVYSFGIIILEMLTGKRPTEELFEDGYNLYSYVEAAYPNNLLEIVDLALLPQQMQRTGTTTKEGTISIEKRTLLHPIDEKCIFSLFEIGLACSAESPKDRLNMKDVIRELNQIRNTLFW